jgi:hypothetical protein
MGRLAGCIGGIASGGGARFCQGIGKRYLTSSSMTLLHMGHVGRLPCLHPRNTPPTSVNNNNDTYDYTFPVRGLGVYHDHLVDNFCPSS